MRGERIRRLGTPNWLCWIIVAGTYYGCYKNSFRVIFPPLSALFRQLRLVMPSWVRERVDRFQFCNVFASFALAVCLISAEDGWAADTTHSFGFDAHGQEMVCSIEEAGLISLSATNSEAFQEWEVIPSATVLGTREPIYIYLRPKRSVKTTRLVFVSSMFETPENLDFHDDGLNGDEVVADGTYTLGPFYLKESEVPVKDKPSVASIGTVQVVGDDDVYSTFITETSVGVLPTGTQIHSPLNLRADAQITSHLLNVSKSGLSTQEWFRGVDTERLFDFMKTVYHIVEDEYDFVVMLSSGRMERVYEYKNRNSVSGMGLTTQAAPFTGDWDQSDLYSSAGKLQHLMALDYQNRGMIPSTLVHEILHRWGAYIDASLQIRIASGHYDVRSSTGSIIGGHPWIKQEDGSFLVDTSIGSGGAYRASPIDLFSMGLLPPPEMPDLYYAPNIDFNGGTTFVLPEDIERTVTSEEILTTQSPHAPDFDDPQISFRILFVIESKDRLLSPVEMTYYNAFVVEAMRELDQSEPDPFVGLEWVPITRFFGERVSWNPSIVLKSSYYDQDDDHDGDGVLTEIEMRMGTNAFSNRSKPELKVEQVDGELLLSVRPLPEEGGIELETSRDLKNWDLYQGDVSRSADEQDATVELGQDRFFRVTVE